MSDGYTEKYFLEEVHRLREQFGRLDFWAKAKDVRDRFVSGLAYVYLDIRNDDGSLPDYEQIKKWAVVFDSTMIEYNRREHLMHMAGKADV